MRSISPGVSQRSATSPTSNRRTADQQSLLLAHSGAPLSCFLEEFLTVAARGHRDTKAGLVGPAFLCGTGSFGLVSIADPAFSKSTAELVLAAYNPLSWGIFPSLRTQINSQTAQRVTVPQPGLHHHCQVLQFVLQDRQRTSGHFDAACRIDCRDLRNSIPPAHQEHLQQFCRFM